MRPRPRPLLLAALAAALVAACQPAAPVGPVKPAAKSPRPAASKAPGTGAGGGTLFPPLDDQAPADPGGLASPAGLAPSVPLLASVLVPGNGVVANNGAGLTGKVKAPAGLIGNNGGGLISDRGGGLIGNNSAGIVSNNGGAYKIQGGAYRLAALPEQGLVPNIRVGLVDAAGALVKDAQGKPFLTTTGPDGSYAFPDAPTDRPLVVLVDLPGGKGQLAAVAPALPASGAAPAPRAVDLDLVSTLTTGYIYNQYVAWQPDPQAVLAKLPADVEAATRAKAEAAFAGSGVAVPARLGPDEVQGTVARMRVADPAFDGQLEAVKKLLVLAGQADLGNGQPATSVQLSTMTALGAGPDGRLYMQSITEQRVWRLTPAGLLEAVAGSASLDLASLTGKRGTEAGLGQMWGFAFDANGRLLLAENGNVQRLSRLGPDGLLTELFRATNARVDAIWPGAGDEVLVLSGGKLLAIGAPGAAPVERFVFGAADKAKLDFVTAFGKAADGKLLLTTAGPVTYRLDPAAPALEHVKTTLELPREPMVDMNGRLFDYDPESRALTRIEPDGGRTPLGVLPQALYQQAVTQGPDGTVYLAAGPRVHKFKDGALTLVAGIAEGGSNGGDANALALAAPAGLVPEADGAVLVADRLANRIWRVKADRTVVPFAGTGALASTGDNGPAADAALAGPGDLGRDAAGNLYVVTPGYVNGNAVRRIAPDGTITSVVAAPTDQAFTELAVAPDGTLFLTLGATVLRLPAGSTEAVALHTEAAQTASGTTRFSLLADASGGVHWAIEDKIAKWTAATGVVTVASNPALPPTGNGGLARDAQGRYYVSSDALDLVVRYDPATDAVTKVAGAGAPLLAGTGPDASLKRPGYLVFDANGDLLLSDEGHKQVKRLAAGSL